MYVPTANPAITSSTIKPETRLMDECTPGFVSGPVKNMTEQQKWAGLLYQQL